MPSPTNRSEHAAWRRLRKNKGALFGIAIIVIAIFIAVFGYQIAPDASPYANRMIVEIGGQKPGSKQTFLKTKKETFTGSTNRLQAFFSGREDRHTLLPIHRYYVADDSVII